jgi:hypothetical protein
MDLLHWGGGDLMSRAAEGISISGGTFANAWADVMHRTLLREIADPDLNTWRLWVSDIVPFGDLTNTKKLIQIGDYQEFPVVAEGGDYLPVTTPGEQKVEFGIQKRGGTEDFTMEAALRDDLGALARIPRKLGRAWAWTVYRHIYSLLQENLGAGRAMDYDSKALYHADHANIGSDVFSATALVSAEDKIRAQKDISSGYPKQYRAKYLLYADESAMRQAIWEALSSKFKIAANANEINLPNFIQQVLGLVPIEVYYPESTTTRWELVANPTDVPTMAVGFLNGNDVPELFVQDMERVGSMFNNDKVTYKLRGTVGAELIDHRSFARGNA